MMKEGNMKINRLAFCFTLLMALGLNVIVSSAQNQEIQFSAYPSKKVKASSITWRKHFGGRKEEPNNVYTLMSQGALRAPTSKNFDNLITSWLEKHPNADTILVYTIGMMRDIPDSKMKSVWVVDGDDNLNIHLVRMGGCPAGTMLLNRGDQTPLTRAEYESFAKKVIEAEESAKKEKSGIWSESQE
jgi:hypothetical protein